METEKQIDLQYIRLVQNVVKNGERRETRNALVYSLFGERLVFYGDGDRFPVLVTKKVSLKNVFEELMWFLRGQTDSRILDNKGVKIWNQNSTKEFILGRGLDYQEGTCGPIYGHQWNHFGAEYNGPNEDYTNQGVNQIDYCIKLIKEDPTSRRILFSAWNPVDLPKMVLPPCHMVFQFYVRGGEFLDGQLYQRSADLMLGVPYNMASYYFLLLMVAHVTGLKAGNLTMCFGDIHVYSNHIDGVKEQVRRSFQVDLANVPRISIKENIVVEDIRGFEMDHFNIDYNPMGPIRMDMVA